MELLVAAVEGGAPPDDCARAAAGIHLKERQNAIEVGGGRLQVTPA